MSGIGFLRQQTNHTHASPAVTTVSAKITTTVASQKKGKRRSRIVLPLTLGLHKYDPNRGNSVAIAMHHKRLCERGQQLGRSKAERERSWDDYMQCKKGGFKYVGIQAFL